MNMSNLSWDKYLGIFCGALLVLLLLTLLKDRPATDIPTRVEVAPTSTEVIPEHFSAPTSTLGWKTYTNYKYGFSISYPPRFDQQGGEGSSNFIERGVFMDIGSPEYLKGLNLVSEASGIPFFLQVSASIPKGVTMSRDVSQFEICSERNRHLMKYVLIDGVMAVKCEESTMGFPGFAVAFRRNGTSPIEYFFDSTQYEGADKRIIDEILSTFRFIPITDFSTWQTYEDQKYGFSIQYPADFAHRLRHSSSTISDDIAKLDIANRGYIETIDRVFGSERNPPFLHIDAYIPKAKLSTKDDIRPGECGGDYPHMTGYVFFDNVTAVKCEGIVNDRPALRIMFRRSEADLVEYIFQSMEYEGEKKEMIDQILSTFRFVPIADFTQWKTYINRAAGFSFRYPPTLDIEVNSNGPLASLARRYLNVKLDLQKDLDLFNTASGTERFPQLLSIEMVVPKEAPTSTYSVLGSGCFFLYHPVGTMRIDDASVTKCSGVVNYLPTLFVRLPKHDAEKTVYVMSSTKYQDADARLVDEILSTFRLLR